MIGRAEAFLLGVLVGMLLASGVLLGLVPVLR